MRSHHSVYSPLLNAHFQQHWLCPLASMCLTCECCAPLLPALGMVPPLPLHFSPYSSTSLHIPPPLPISLYLSPPSLPPHWLAHPPSCWLPRSQVYSPGFLGLASSAKGENSYSYSPDMDVSAGGSSRGVSLWRSGAARPLPVPALHMSSASFSVPWGHVLLQETVLPNLLLSPPPPLPLYLSPLFSWVCRSWTASPSTRCSFLNASTAGPTPRCSSG